MPVDKNHLMPWEPEVYKGGCLFVQGVYTPDDVDECEECGMALDDSYEFMVSSHDDCFCSWLCLLRRAKRYPEFYRVEHTGAYDVK